MAGRVNLMGTAPIPMVAPILLETALIRKLRSEVAAMKTLLNESQMDDELTEGIREWYFLYAEALTTNRNTQAVYERFLGLMQKILIDPITHTPLDMDAVLGSDGRTYGKKQLRIYLSSLPPRSKEEPIRSPLNPNDVTPFTAEQTPHPIVSYFVRWLSLHGSLHLSEEVNKKFRELEIGDKLPKVPSSAAERIRLIMKENAERNRLIFEESKKRHSDIEVETKSMKGKVKELFKPVQDGIKDLAITSLDRINAIKENNKKQIKHLKEASKKLGDEIVVLEKRIGEVTTILATVDSGISETERENLQLELAGDKLEKSIKQRKQSWMDGFLGAAVMITACIVVNYLIPGGSSISGSFVPSSKKILFNVSIAI